MVKFQPRPKPLGHWFLGFRWVLGFGIWVLACTSSSAQTLNWPSEAPPRPLSARAVQFPPYEIRTLSNGLRVVIVLHHEQPAVSLRLLVGAGSVHNPPDKPGIASLAAALLDQGTTTKSAEQIADAIDSIGGAMGTGAGADLTFVNGVVMKDSFDLAMELIADVVRNPAFAQDEIDRQREQALSSLQVSLSDPDYVASVAFDRLVYGFHPYGLPASGTPESLASIRREDLQAFHRRYFVPNNMILAVVGDVTGEEAFSTAERVFGKWPRADVPPLKLMEPPPPTRRVIVIDKPDAVQTEVRVGHLGIPRKHEDYTAVDLAIKILGGEGANRLHRVLRSERGLTYGASADMQAFKQAGDFVAETDTRTETTGEALRLTVEEFMRLRRERVGNRELSDAQAYLAGNFPLTIETPDAIATQVLNAVFYELPIEEIGTFPERVQAVRPDDVQRVAQRYVMPDRLSVVLVGNAAAFASQLKGIGFPDFEVIPIEDVDLTSVSLRREKRAARSVESFGTFRSLPGAPAYAKTSSNVLAGWSSESALSQQAALKGCATWLEDCSRWSSASTLSPQAALKGCATWLEHCSRWSSASALLRQSGRPELLARVIEAKGGVAKLKGVRTVIAEAETTFRGDQGPLPSRTITYVMYPERFRVDATVAGAEVAQVYNAGMAWVRDPGGVHDAPAPMREDFAASVRRDTIPLLIAATEGTATVRVLPEEGKGGTSYRVLEIANASAPAVKLYVDKAGLIARQEFTAPGPDGRPLQVEEVLSDYRVVDGIQIPFRAELHHNGRLILERTLTAVRLNTDVDAKLFEKPN